MFQMGFILWQKMARKIKNRKGEVERLIKMIMWVVFAVLIIGGVYFFIQTLFNR